MVYLGYGLIAFVGVLTLIVSVRESSRETDSGAVHHPPQGGRLKLHSTKQKERRRAIEKRL